MHYQCKAPFSEKCEALLNEPPAHTDLTVLPLCEAKFRASSCVSEVQHLCLSWRLILPSVLQPLLHILCQGFFCTFHVYSFLSATFPQSKHMFNSLLLQNKYSCPLPPNTLNDISLFTAFTSLFSILLLSASNTHIHIIIYSNKPVSSCGTFLIASSTHLQKTEK